MSYNYVGVEEIVLDAYMDPNDVLRLLDDDDAELAECCFLHDMKKSALKVARLSAKCEKCQENNKLSAKFCSGCGVKMLAPAPVRLALPNFCWYGEGSGRGFDFLEHKIAPLITGEVQVIIIGEDGAMAGFAIKNGRTARVDVKRSLQLPKDW